MKELIVVCTGNTCRSPMGAAILQRHIEDLGKQEEYRAESGGLSAEKGEPAAQNAILAMKEIGIDISEHQAQNVKAQPLEDAEKIYVMTTSHRDFLINALPKIEDKIKVIGVSDPFGQDIDAYRYCRDYMISYFDGEQL